MRKLSLFLAILMILSAIAACSGQAAVTANVPAKDLLAAAYALYVESYASQLSVRPVRGLTVRVHALSPEDMAGEQMLFDLGQEDHSKEEGLERALDKLREKYGENSIRTGNLYTDIKLSGVLSHSEHDEETEISLD